MSFLTFLSWLVYGLAVGLCARFLVPGRQFLSLPVTVAAGIAGAVLGGCLYSLFPAGEAPRFFFDSHHWYGWILSILGATFLVWLYPYAYPRKWLN